MDPTKLPQTDRLSEFLVMLPDRWVESVQTQRLRHGKCVTSVTNYSLCKLALPFKDFDKGAVYTPGGFEVA